MSWTLKEHQKLHEKLTKYLEECLYSSMQRHGGVNVTSSIMDGINNVPTPNAKRRDPMITQDDLENRFTYHKPTPKKDQPGRYEVIRNKAKELAEIIVDYTPDSREQSLAITKLEEVVMWANAAIARNE